MRAKSIYSNLSKTRLLFLPRPKKVLFEHIPKCGGTAVKRFLTSQYLNKKIFSIDGFNPSKSIGYFKSLPEEKRYKYDLILGHGAHKLRQYSHPSILKTTIFRDPIDRIVSHYFYVLRTPDHYLYGEVVNNSMSLLDYVTSGLGTELRNNYVTRFLQIPVEEAEKDPEDSIARAYSLLRDEYSVVGTLDCLNEAVDELADLANFNTRFKNKKLNVTSDRPRLQEIDSEVIRAVEQVNYLDVKLYGLIKGGCEFSYRREDMVGKSI